LAAIGAAPDPVPFAELTAERLADALGRAVRRPEYTEAAARGALHMAAEDGAGHTLKAVEQLALQ
ncbi:glycosyltransferase, partial [Streptomyces sp. SID9944]|nr:glycosyltransferase [Streptomyces sp. SID9944]